MFKFDVFVPIGDPFEESVLSRRVRVELNPGVTGYVYSPEDIIIQKLRWFVLGNRVSDRQWNDIVQVLQIQFDFLDRSYMSKWAKEFGLEQLLVDAISEAGA